jgi:hypothetical protein
VSVTDVPPTEAIDWILRVGATGLLAIALWAGLAKKWRWGYQFDEMQELLQKKDDELERMRTERDIWIERTLKLNKITAEASVQTMKAVVTKAEE